MIYQYHNKDNAEIEWYPSGYWVQLRKYSIHFYQSTADYENKERGLKAIKTGLKLSTTRKQFEQTSFNLIVLVTSSLL